MKFISDSNNIDIQAASARLGLITHTTLKKRKSNYFWKIILGVLENVRLQSVFFIYFEGKSVW